MAKGAPFSPLVFVQKDGQRIPRRVTAGKGEDAAAVAKQLAATEPDAEVTAFAVDGAIEYNGRHYSGIVVESWNFRANRGARIGLRYEVTGTIRKKPSLLGSLLHRGRNGWYDPEELEGPVGAVPTFPEVPVSAPPPDAPAPASAVPAPAPVLDLGTPGGFGPPPSADSLAPVAIAPPPPPSALPPPPAAFPPPVVEPAGRPEFGPPPSSAAVLGLPPPTTAPASAAREYTAVPIQRSETPLGNRAMFAGIMELATTGRSFPAFAIVQKDGAWEQVTMTDANLQDSAASVRDYARSRTDADFIAFAVDGFVTVEGAPVSAVVVEVWEYATRVSFSVAQRYVPTGDPPSPRLSGRPLMRTQDGWIDVPSSMTLGGQVQFGYRDPDPV